MSTLGFIEYEQASAEVRAVYDDIKATRKIDKVTNFWKALAHDPVRLKRVWEDTKSIMACGRARSAGERTVIRGGKRQQSVRLLHRRAYCVRAQERHDRGDVQ